MSVAGSTSSQGTHSRSPSRSRSPPYSDGRYPPSSRYSSRYDSYNYRPNRNGMSAALDDYRDLRDRERDRDRDRSMGLMRDDRYLSPRGRDSHDRYTPSYYRDDIPPSHHYSSSSSNIMPRDYSKTNPLRRDVSTDQTKDVNKITTSSSSSSVKDLKDDNKPNTPTSEYTPSNRYLDWRDRDRDRDRDRRYREDDRRRDYDRRGYMRDLRYDSSSYGAPLPPPPMNYQVPPFNGDSYRPDRDRDRDMPPSPSIPYYERDRLDDRDFYRPGRNNPTTSSNPPPDYDRYRRGNRPNWTKPEDSPRRLDRDRPERIVTDTTTTAPSSERTSPVKEAEKPVEKKDEQVQEDSNSPIIEKPSIVNLSEPATEGLETGEVVEEKPELITEPEPMQEVIVPVIEPSSPPPVEKRPTPASPQMEQGEVVEEDIDIKPAMTQEQIVNRIDDIENELSIEEELLAIAEKREREALEQENANADDEDEMAEDEAAQNKEEAKKQALQAMENDPCADVMDYTDDVSSPMMRKRPQLLINQLRSKNDEEDDRLYEKILADNRKVAKKNGGAGDDEDWSDEEKWTKPLHPSIQDYPCYQENIAKFDQLRISVSHSLATQKVALQKKERFLKNEYKALYEQWKEKNVALDRIRDIERKGSDKFGGHRTSSRRLQEQQPEEYTDGVIFTANSEDALRFSNGGASTPYNNSGLYTSDAARSEAELLEIIQSLESAEMRNPENRAKKTTATIPSMILDVRERMRTYDDRSRLVKDPLTYYHTGPDTGDVWNQQEVTTFMESYMMYPKQFERISVAIGTKTACQCVLFYYRKKKKIDFKALMKKGRRGKANKNRDRIAAAIRIATNDSSPTGRKAKSKGSALMTDIGEAQNSRKAKEKDAAERKSKELRDLEQANQYWDSVAERKKTRRPTVAVPPIFTPIVPSGPPSSASDDTDTMLTSEKRRSNSGSTVPRRNKGKSPREVPTEPVLAIAAEPRQSEDIVMDSAGDDEEDKTVPYAGNAAIGGGVAKWSDREKEMAVEAFKEHGRDFVQVSGLVKSKTEEQCRNFYHNFKRKFGPNAFNEEDARSDLISDVHSEMAAISGRTDLKAEEEDAAAALVGMFQMGANTNMKDDAASRSRTSSSDIVLPLPPPPSPPVSVPMPTLASALSPAPAHTHTPISLPLPLPRQPLPPQQPQSQQHLPQKIQAPPPQQPLPPPPPPQQQKQQQQQQQKQKQQPLSTMHVSITPAVAPPIVTPPLSSSMTNQQLQQQRRRRVRSSSSRAESVNGDEASEWADGDYGSRSGGRKLGRTTSVSDSKRPVYSSYWSVSERNEFQRLLSMYGRNWDRVASEMKSKTVIQVRNFYVNNEEKMQLKDVVDRYHSNRHESMPPMGTSFDTSAAHFQALQNFPFPSPIVDSSTPVQPVVTSTPISNYPRASYFSSPPPPPPPTNNYPRPIATPSEPPSAVTKVADLLNKDDPAEPSQSSWDSWFGT